MLFAALALPAQPSLPAAPRALQVFAQEEDQSEPLDQAPEIPSGQPADATPSSVPVAAPRPILHFDIEGSAGQQRAVLVAVDAGGNRVMTRPVAVGGTWSPRGDWFAFFTGGADARHGALVRANLAGESQRLFTATGDEVLLPLGWAAWSPDASKIAVLSFVPAAGLKDYRFALVIIDAVDGQVLARHPLPVETMAAWPAYMAGVDKFRWSPDGRRVLLSWGNAIVVDVASGEVEQVASTQVVAEWAPGSDAVYYLAIPDRSQPSRDENWAGLYIKYLGSPAPVQLMESQVITASGLVRSPFNHGLLTLSPTGTKLALVTGIAGGRVALRVYGVGSDELIALDRPSSSFPTANVLTAVEWAPDESSLAAIAVGPELRIVLADLATGQWRTLSSMHWTPQSDEIDLLGLAKTLSWTQ